MLIGVVDGSRIALLHGSKLILAGDHLQLPPTVKCKEAARSGLSQSLFDRLLRELEGQNVKCTLTIQYRMHEKIMAWSNQCLYNHQLTCHPSIQFHLLSHLPNVTTTDLTSVPIYFIDTQGLWWLEIGL